MLKAFFFIISSLYFLECFSKGSDTLYNEYKSLKNQYTKFENLHGNIIETDNGIIHYLTIGNSSNPTLVWLHGSLSSSYEIIPFKDSLLSKDIFIISIDYYGHGKSSLPKVNTTFYHLADDIDKILEKHNINKCIIGGFSRGAYIATAFYDSYPQKTQALILEDGGVVPFNLKYHKISSDSISSTLESMLFPKIKLMDEFNTEFDAFKALKEFDEHQTFASFNLINKRKNKWHIYKGLDSLYGFQSKERLYDLIFRPSVVDSYASSIVKIDPATVYRNLNIPLLLLEAISDSDPFPFEYFNSHFANIHKNFVSHYIFEGVNHNIHYEQPERYINTIIQFIDKLK